MHKPIPPLNALRAFEVAARHLSFTRAATEMNLTPGALSHQIRGLEGFLGVRLFERGPRAVTLTPYGTLLYPGLQAGFGLIRDAVAGLHAAGGGRVLVISTSPGLTSKWLATRLYRFAEAHPEIEIRVSSSPAQANFATDGVDAAIRCNVPSAYTDDPVLHYEKLIDVVLTPVCSPKLVAKFGPLDVPGVLPQVPLIHDDSLAGRPEAPTWQDWLAVAGLVGGNLNRGLRFNSADHALDAALQGAGILLAHTILAHDDLSCGRLVRPFKSTVCSGRAYYFVCPKMKEKQPNLQLFRDWLHAEAGRLDLQLMGLS